MSNRHQVIFLYTELAPYFIACLRQLVKDHPVEVHLVRWPLNAEAPFDLEFPQHVNVHERNAMDDVELVAWAKSIEPDIVFASGWVDRGYLKVCRAMRKQEVPTVMCSDTAWQGTAKQRAATAMAMFWISGTFSHAWVTGKKQAQYARKLGFRKQYIRQGFYSADVEKFAPLAERFRKERGSAVPHRFLCVARYISSKGHQYLMEAFVELCNEGHAGDWELWCVGIGELHPPKFEHERIKHLGFVQTEELWKVQKDCGVFVLPSLFEPWGVVVQEHALAGFPMLLSDAVGAGERFLKKAQNGQYFKAGDKDSLKKVMKKIIAKNDNQLIAMGERSAELGKELDPKRWAATVVELME